MLESKKFKRRVAAAIISIMLIIAAYAFIGGNNEKTRIVHETTSDGGITWFTEDGTVVDFPLSVKGKKGFPVSIRSTLPTHIPEKWAMEFLSLYAACEVSVDGEIINSYGTTLPLTFGKLTGNIRVITELNPSMSGKDITITFTPYYNIHMDISGVSFGSIAAVKYSIAIENMVRMAVVISLLIILLIGIGLTIYQAREKNEAGFSLFSNFCFFTMIVIMWVICSSDMPQFYTNANEAVALVSFLSLASVGIPYLGFCAQVLKRGSRICEVLGIAGWILPIINIIGFCGRLYDPLEVLILSHLYIGGAAILTLVLAFLNQRGGAETKILLTATIIISLGFFVGVGFYYIAPSQGYAGTVVGLAMVAFVATLFVLVLNRQITYVRERKYLDTYKELAYRDMLTGLNNRAAFDKLFNELPDKYDEGTEVTLFMFDLNNLKRVNDEMGHIEGDRLIKDMSDCLDKTFKNVGTAYRLGGDEFAAVVIGSRKNPDKLLREFESNVEYCNIISKGKLSAAKGYYQKPLIKNASFARDLYRYADQAMYADKQRKNYKS
ncbi:MAG: GGDEF domain-containing protein [Lachnospiraceae bacterium]|nr:GGDEF domain-containing protein [Lachnospiraceae bacterium]